LIKEIALASSAQQGYCAGFHVSRKACFAAVDVVTGSGTPAALHHCCHVSRLRRLPLDEVTNLYHSAIMLLRSDPASLVISSSDGSSLASNAKVRKSRPQTMPLSLKNGSATEKEFAKPALSGSAAKFAGVMFADVLSSSVKETGSSSASLSNALDRISRPTKRAPFTSWPASSGRPTEMSQALCSDFSTWLSSLNCVKFATAIAGAESVEGMALSKSLLQAFSVNSNQRYFCQIKNSNQKHGTSLGGPITTEGGLILSQAPPTPGFARSTLRLETNYRWQSCSPLETPSR